MSDNLPTRLYRHPYDPEDDTIEVAHSLWLRPTSVVGEQVDEQAIRADAAAKERERVFAALFRDAEQMYGWTREETLDQFPRLAAIERGEHTEGEDAM